ncbi:hypothetical protein MKX03_018889 [Papaver bracteatum]|nr:hypothetical protein MKX03_018889 [Papaver bracteatum]
MEKSRRLRKPVDSSYGQIKNLNLLKSNTKVKNPCKQTQVFIEVQVIGKCMNRTTSGLLFDEHCTDGLDAKLLMHKLFQIDFDDLFSKDVFANCDFSSLLSIDVSRSSSTTRKFWNSFKRCMSRFIDQRCTKYRCAKYPSKFKRSLLVIAATVEMVGVVGFDDEEDALKELETLRVSVRHRSKNINNANHADVAYINKPGSNFLSIFGSGTFKTGIWSKTDVSNSNYDGDNNNDEDCLDGNGKDQTKKTKNKCSICILEFEEGESVTGTACDLFHLFHNKCILPWFNMSGICPLCRRPILLQF